MNRLFARLSRIAGLLALATTLGCTHGQKAADTTAAAHDVATTPDHRQPANSRLAVLPDQASWQALYDFVDTLDLTNPSYNLSMHNGNGTSVYGVLTIGSNPPAGAVIPENSSSQISGEIMAFTLSRALGVSQIYQSGVYHRLTGGSLEKLMAIVPREPIRNKAGKIMKNKEENRQAILKRYQKDPSGMDIVFKRWDEKPKDVDGIAGVGPLMNTSFTAPGSSAPLASLVQCEGPQPSANRTVSFAGGTNTELEIAREISAILLIDALTQQWDRFSGGNLQTVTKNGHAMFVSIDNGGTWGGTKSTTRNLSMVTRFDRDVANEILAMDDFIERGVPYKGLRNDAEFVSAFDIAQSPKAYKMFKASLIKTAAHIRSHSNCFFN